MSGFGAILICLVVFQAGQSSAYWWRPVLYPRLNVNDRIIARWTNNLYYAGKVSSIRNGEIRVLFDDGDKITHSTTDVSAVIPDRVPHQVDIGDHVVATWKGGSKYYIGYVSDKESSSRLKVTFDSNDEDYYTSRELRIFPEHLSAHAEGARVFARGTSDRYRRGFVKSATSKTVFINYDDGNTASLYKNDSAEVVLDTLPCYTDIRAGQRVIGFWPESTVYYPGDVAYKRKLCSSGCYRKAAYQVLFDAGENRVQDFHHIRVIPCKT